MGEVALIDVSKRFSLRVAGESQTVQALARVSFTVRDGEIVSLIGPSGCGKTTALRVAMGLETASSGRVTVDGREVKGCGHDRGMVFQHAELLPWLTALQNVMFGLEMKGMRGAELRDTAARYLDLVGLGASRDRRLVHQQHLRVDRERAGDADALLHAAGQLIRPPVDAVAQTDQRQIFHRGVAQRRTAHAFHLQAELDVLERGEPR